jgi:hypothetical protein
MKDTIFAIGSLVEHPTNGRGIIIDAEDHREDGMLWRIRWDEPVVWRERLGEPPEAYQTWWTDDEDLDLISETK